MKRILITGATSGIGRATALKLAAADTEIIITGTNGPGDTQSMAHEEWARRLNEMGGWNAKALVSSEMGNTDDVLEAGMLGEPLTAATDPSRLAAYVPEMGILMMPYMFESYSQLDKLMETELYKEWEAKLYDQGIVLLTANGLTGWGNMAGVTGLPTRRSPSRKT